MDMLIDDYSPIGDYSHICIACEPGRWITTSEVWKLRSKKTVDVHISRPCPRQTEWPLRCLPCASWGQGVGPERKGWWRWQQDFFYWRCTTGNGSNETNLIPWHDAIRILLYLLMQFGTSGTSVLSSMEVLNGTIVFLWTNLPSIWGCWNLPRQLRRFIASWLEDEIT